MNILLIQPPVQDFYQTGSRTQPLGLAYLAASLQQHGHTASILDCQVPGLKKQLPVPRKFSYLKDFYAECDISPFRLYSKYFHFGISYEAIREYIKLNAPHAVGISCQFTPYVDETFTVASVVKSVDPDIPVIVGGAHASCLPGAVLASPHIDYVILGEGEETLPELVQYIAAGEPPLKLAGIGFKADGSIRVNPRKKFIQDLDSLPFPARDLLNFSYYTINGKPYTMLLTSRGCPQNCSYCSVQNIMGKQLRSRSPEQILREMRLCRDRFGISLFDIEDDNFTYDQKRALDLLTLVIEEFGEDALQLFAMNGLSILSLNKELLWHMRKAGFRHLDLALGSSVVAASRKMNRPCDLAKTDEVLQQASDVTFPVTTYVIIGLAGQRLEDMMDSLIFLMERPTLLGPSIFYPSPGTEAFKALDGDGSFFASDYSLLRSSVFPVETDEFARLDIVTLLRLARWINFIKRIMCDLGIHAISLGDLTKTAQQWWGDSIPENQGDCFNQFFPLSSIKPFSQKDAGTRLTALFLHWKIFYGIRRIKRRNKELYTYKVFPYKTSSRVERLFFDTKKSLIIKAAFYKKSV